MLLLNQMSHRPNGTAQDFEHAGERARRYPLYRYASLMWPVFAKDHLQDETVWSLVCRLFDPQKNDAFCSWSQELYLFSFNGFRWYWQGEPREIEKAIKAGLKDFNSAVLHQGFTTLHIAAALGFYDICLDLIQKGVDPNAMCVLGSPLHFSISPGWLSGLKVEGDLSSNRDPDGFLNCISTDDRKHFYEQRLLVVDLLVSRGAIPAHVSADIQPQFFSSCLTTCLRMADFRMVLSLVEAGIRLRDDELQLFRDTILHARDLRIPPPHLVQHFSGLLGRLESLTGAVAVRMRQIVLGFLNTVETDAAGSASCLPATIMAPLNNPSTVAALAAQQNNAKTLEAVLEGHQMDVDEKVNDNGDTLLHVAVRHNSLETVEILLRYECSPFVANSAGDLPAWLCVHDTHARVLCALLKYKPEVARRGNLAGDTIWHLAASRDSCQVLGVLFEVCPDAADLQNFQGFTPLATALRHNQDNAARLMIERQPGVLRNWKAKVPLMHFVAASCSLEFAQAAMDAGAERCERWTDGSTPLHHLGFSVSASFVKFMKQTYTNLEATDALGAPESQTSWEKFCSAISDLQPHRQTLRSNVSPQCFPLMEVAVSRLVQKGVVASHEKVKHSSSVTVFVSALYRSFLQPFPYAEKLIGVVRSLLHTSNHASEAINSEHMFRLLREPLRGKGKHFLVPLLSMGVKPTVKVELDGCCALESACSMSRNPSAVDALKILLAAVPEPRANVVNELRSGKALIHLTTGHHGIGALADAGADLNMRTASGDPAICHHIKQRRYHVAGRLAELGADPTLPDENGHDAITHAALHGRRDLLELFYRLQKENRLPRDIDWYRKVEIAWTRETKRCGRGKPAYLATFPDGVFRGCSVLQVATIQNHIAVMEFVLEKNFVLDIEEPAEGGWTAMHFAAYRGSAPAIKLLHRHGAHLHSVAKDEQPEATLAAEKNIMATCTPHSLTRDEKGSALRTLEWLSIRDHGISNLSVETPDAWEEISIGTSGDHKSLIRADDPELADRQSAAELPFLPSMALEEAARARESAKHNTEGPLAEPPSTRRELRYGWWFEDLHLAVTAGLSAAHEYMKKEKGPPRRQDIVELLHDAEPDTSAVPCERHGELKILGDGDCPWPLGIPCYVAARKSLGKLLPAILTNCFVNRGHVFGEYGESPLHTAVSVGADIETLVMIVTHLKENWKTYA
ncbi:ankyrin repeat-containing domain protein [Podospora aff. communis PSN243]|uniref:Ankyrin repeat-containing domain protein n=1 Tax=Podospora aff. communis PSN243 TaxID=3040156 RepID=A0AAV9GBV3_9PEZI|nr:ankyrin repeat-containing domain protein [Podospora aff. communis PSN243]